MKIEVIPKLLPIYTTDKRFTVLYGGRSGGKSWTVADYLISKSLEAPKLILGVREFQASIRDSSHKLISDRIKHYKLENLFTITDHSIRNKVGSEFIFSGMYRNEQGIRGKEGVDICWGDESQSISRESLDALIPTIRKPGNQIIFTLNPHKATDAVYQDFIIPDRDDTLKIKINYYDNPFTSEETLLSIENDKRLNIDRFNHKWEGHCISHSDAQIFKGKWIVEDFKIDNSFNSYFSMDFGFSNDPSAVVHIAIRHNTLYIVNEAVAVGVDIDKLPQLMKKIQGIEQYPITADSSRPDTISYLRQHGFPKIKGSIKGKNSVVEGIEFIKSFDKIIIHPQCKTTIDEFQNYSYKTDKYSGMILDEPIDTYNHCIDAIRYGLEDVMRNRRARSIPNISL